ncbi:MAG: DUF4139 domain-containing protein [Candidatus Chryseobacterium colombiense]|nr:DUF4139 domain-containing protein [Chryseobacterium sp.]WEK68829.1 MAG: DUF4139 domain-containing protein [Chryseobacterium sp.]
MMKINVLVLFLTVFMCFGQENYTVTTSKIKEAKIYYSGGMVKQSFSADVLPGKNYIIIKEFGRNSGIDISSFKPDKKITLIRYESYNDNAFQYSDKIGKNYDTDAINDSIELYRKSYKKIEQDLSLIRNSIGIVQKNQGLQSPTSADIVKMIEFNQKTLKEFYTEETSLNAKLNATQSKISALENKRNVSSRNSGLSNILVLQVTSDKKQHVNFEVNQNIQGANWRPYYVIKSNGIQSPLKILYKAKIQQNTGLELKNVPIKLINGSFSSEDKPYELDRWFLRTEKDYYVSNQAFQREKSSSNERAYAIQEVAVIGKSKISQKTMKTEISLDKDTVIPTDIEVTEDINEFDVTTGYKYFTTPKLENKTFLLAYIKDYSKYNFLPGNADVFMEDMLIGTINIDTNQLTNEMLVSLGSDSNILTKRELINKQTKDLGEKEKFESYSYEITVKNNKDTTINLELKDQIPLSTAENVKIEMINPDNANYNKEQGSLIWNFNIKPNETKKIKFGFNVTLPKDLITVDIK